MVDYSVLIIDDDIWMQRILSKILHSYGFKKTYLASNGFEGIALAVEHQPAIIIMDILMPELSGHLTLKILKTIKITKAIPVVMVSALSDTENLGKAVKSGTAGFISKPFTRATIYDKLVSVFGKEKLDMIAKGKSPEKEFEYQNQSYNIGETKSESLSQTQAPAAARDYSPKESVEKTNDDDKTKSEPNKKVPDNQILQHYQDDEKRSIESIKKMLLKNRK